jgi:hypothetical protein
VRTPDRAASAQGLILHVIGPSHDAKESVVGLWKTRLAARLADELTPAIIARFHDKYTKSDAGCWLWKAGRYSNGYGLFYVCRVNGRQLNVQAHRLAYLLANGELPHVLVVRHRCDTPACVNPDHLVLGSQADNINDAHQQGKYDRPMKVGSVRWIRQQRRIGAWPKRGLPKVS